MGARIRARLARRGLKVRAVVAVADEEQAELRAEIEHLRRDLREVQRGWLDRPLASNWHYSQAIGHILDRADLRKDGGNVIPGPFGGLGG